MLLDIIYGVFVGGLNSIVGGFIGIPFFLGNSVLFELIKAISPVF